MAQSVDLCGGAAAAMVLRYWGVSDVHPEDFAPLVDPQKGGISTADLFDALLSRGATPRSIRAEAADVAAEIERGRPVIALIDGGGGRLHYVVIVGWTNDRVLYHDPSVGPFQLRRQAEFQKLWKVTNGFALLVTPQPRAMSLPETAPLHQPEEAGGVCDTLVNPTVAIARGADPEAAVPALSAAAELCPGEAGALFALAGVRFRQERWEDSAHYARKALERDAGSVDMWRLLGASLYLADQPEEALEAWNHIEEPRLDRVQIEGLVRTRHDLATAVIGLRGRDVVTPHSMTMAQRRVTDMPTFPNARVTYRPTSGGQANVVVTVAEADLTEPWTFLLARLAGKALVRRELSLQINSPTGRGESLNLGGRFAANRPAAWVSIDTPRLGGLPGVVSLSGLWDRQTYRPDPAPGSGVTVETRRRGALLWSHWLRASARIEAGLAVDRFDRLGTFVSPRVGGEIRLAQDRLALLGDFSFWASPDDRPGFFDLGASLAMRTSTRPRRLVVTARADGRRAGKGAPLAIWPGAGTGPGRSFLLRASPLINDGQLVGEAFGRGLLHATVEAEVRVVERGPARLGLAAFCDWAKTWDSALQEGSGTDLWAVGVGVRVRAFSNAAFRIDLALRPGSRDLVLSAGVIPPWPR